MTSGSIILQAGVDRSDITPRHPISLAGYATRAELGPAGTVSAPLRLRTLALSAGSHRALFLSGDLLWWGTDTAARIRYAIAEQCAMPVTSIMLHATHSHSGPQTSFRFVPLLGEPDRGYIDQLCAAAVASAERAISAMAPVRVERASVTLDIAVDRRHARTRGAIPANPIDTVATVVRFAADRWTKAILVHYACHPVVHHGNVVTSDFTGAAMDQIEDSAPGAVAFYAQGCCGDVNPALYRAGRFVDGGQEAANKLGQTLADAVQDALCGPMSPLAPVHPIGSCRTAQLPVASLPTVTQLEHLEQASGLRGEWARLLLRRPDRITPTVPVTISRLPVADGLTLLGMSGEPVSAYGHLVKAVSGGAVLPLGYTNGMTGYLVTARQLAEGGYEADTAPYYFGMPGPLSAASESVLKAALYSAIKESS